MCTMEVGMGVTEWELSGMHLLRDLGTGASKVFAQHEAPGSKEN